MNIKKITTTPLALIIAVLAAITFSVVLPGSARAADDNSKASNAGNSETTSYVYVTQPSDSYTLMARKAVQTYGKKYKVDLNLGQILFAETNLTLEAGSPQLSEGQKVTISESAVKNWVDKAKSLSAAAVAGWNAYVPGVDFNTDHVGEK